MKYFIIILLCEIFHIYLLQQQIITTIIKRKDMETTTTFVKERLKLKLDNSDSALRTAMLPIIESLRVERNELFKQTGENKTHPLFERFCEVNRKYLQAVRELPPADKSLQDVSIMLFNSDRRFTINE